MNPETAKPVPDQTRLAALYEVSQVLGSSLDLDKALLLVMDSAIRLNNAGRGYLMLFDEESGELQFRIARNAQQQTLEEFDALEVSRSVVQQVAESGMPVVTTNAQTDPRFSKSVSISAFSLRSIMAAPLKTRGKVTGVIYVDHKIKEGLFNQQDLDLLNAFAGQAAVAIENARLYTELLAAYDATIEGWARALDLRDKETEGHSRRVTELTLCLAERVGMSVDERIYIRWGALLHDIGKMGIPDEILLKPSKLTLKEWDTMRKHPVYAYEMLRPIAYLRPALDIPYCHHEKWDGTGYPRGLKGEQIPLSARLFALVDVWDALCSDRPYRDGWPQEGALEHIVADTGAHFDPQLTPVFVEMVKERAGNG